MKKHAELQSVCICGKAVVFKIAKPKPYDPTIAKSSCVCGSRYMLSCVLDKKTGEAHFDVTALELSDAAKSAAKERILDRAVGV